MNKIILLRLKYPVLLLISVVIFMLVSLSIIGNNIMRLKDDNDQAVKTEALLRTKLASLQNISGKVVDQSQAVLKALPEKSSVISAISQIKAFASQAGITVSNISTGGVIGKGTINSTQLSFEADGQFANMAAFLAQISNSAPIMRFDTIKITSGLNSANIFHLAADLTSYSAPLPEKIPSIGEPITTLTAEEQKSLSQISSLSQPNLGFSLEEISSTPPGRLDPFGN